MPLSLFDNDVATLAWNPPSPAPRTWSRVVLATLAPHLDGGRWPVRRSVGEPLEVVAGFITDGHDLISAELVVTRPDGTHTTRPMPLRYNDEYVARFTPDTPGDWQFRVRGWLDAFRTWQDQFRRRVAGGEGDALVASELLDAAALLRRRAEGAGAADKKRLEAYAKKLEKGDRDAALDPDLALLAARTDPRDGLVESAPQPVAVDPEKARFAAWYEFFPRSAADEPGVHGTLDDAARRLGRIKAMGFDIVYLPPVHPVGVAYRKGKDNAPEAAPGEPGSPWAIGGFLEDGTKGGHKSVHPELGGMPAFERFMDEARSQGLEVALDIAFQCSPDHPYVEEHPEWFRHRPDGTIRYAENPPKKYQDVYPFDFECEAWPALWNELRSVFTFWIDRGVKVFRVDNPHTKPFAFWEWCLRTLREDHPELIFLAEAFSRPRIMRGLAKIGFNNSYTYFAWRNTAKELQEYGEELFTTEVGEYFRPNFWPNTPDIFHEELEHGGRPLHIARFVVAATLSPAYGIYGPPYEHVFTNKHPQREEYADNEKYEIRTWNWDDPYSLQPLFTRVNQIRNAEPALQFARNVQFVETGNPHLLAYLKWHEKSRVLVVVNLDPYNVQEGWLAFSPGAVGLEASAPFRVYDALGGETYHWQGDRHYVRLDPHAMPAHVFVLHGQEAAPVASAPASAGGH